MILRLQGVTKYYGGLKALDGLSVEVRPGAIGLLGPNGAGKSTLIKSLLGLVRLTAGEATVLGLNARTDSSRVRQSVGYMPEDDCYLAGQSGVTSVAYVGELAGLPPRTALRRAHEMLDYVGIREERYREIQTYSTGMKQKVKLAQAIVHSPKLVFLDEPTSGLDPEGRERMLHLIRNLPGKSDVSVVVSTHILHDVETCCDAVLILARGRLLVYDALENLRRIAHEQYTVRFTGDAATFQTALGDRHVTVEQIDEDEFVAFGKADDIPSAIFASARQAGAVVRQLSPSRNSLEDIFMKAVAGN